MTELEFGAFDEKRKEEAPQRIIPLIVASLPASVDFGLYFKRKNPEEAIECRIDYTQSNGKGKIFEVSVPSRTSGEDPRYFHTLCLPIEAPGLQTLVLSYVNEEGILARASSGDLVIDVSLPRS